MCTIENGSCAYPKIARFGGKGSLGHWRPQQVCTHRLVRSSQLPRLVHTIVGVSEPKLVFAARIQQRWNVKFIGDKNGGARRLQKE
jgi:hypothetical protein